MTYPRISRARATANTGRKQHGRHRSQAWRSSWPIAAKLGIPKPHGAAHCVLICSREDGAETKREASIPSLGVIVARRGKTWNPKTAWDGAMRGARIGAAGHREAGGEQPNQRLSLISRMATKRQFSQEPAERCLPHLRVAPGTAFSRHFSRRLVQRQGHTVLA